MSPLGIFLGRYLTVNLCTIHTGEEIGKFPSVDIFSRSGGSTRGPLASCLPGFAGQLTSVLLRTGIFLEKHARSTWRPGLEH